jgi:hypothetical protein
MNPWLGVCLFNFVVHTKSMKKPFALVAFLVILILRVSTPAMGCSTPSSVALASRTTNSITISYSASGAFHQIEYGTLGFALGNGQRSAWVTSPTFLRTDWSLLRAMIFMFEIAARTVP